MMADQDKPRVKLPGVIMRKPMVPGPNSWAQSRQEQQGSSTGEQLNVGRVTNRDKYEHKPMPPPPPDSSPPNQHMQAKTYIQPAIPLVNSAPAVQIQQKRAVTDPVAPKPLFAGRKLSVAKLRKKYSFSKAKDEAPEAEAMPTIQSSPAVRISSEKAAEVLGLYPPRENKPDTPLASASLAPGPDPFRSSSDSVERTASPARQVQSTPVLTRRYIKENGLPTPTVTAAPTASNQGANEDTQNQIQDPKKAGDAMFTPGMLHPPRLRRYENVGEVGLVEANGMHRVESFSGVIENAEFSPGINGGMYTGSAGACSQSSMIQGLSTGDLLPPVIYSPSNYGGVWENDPAVGYSLPPFSPMPNGRPPNHEIDRSGPSDNRGMPNMPNTPNEFMNGYGNSNYTGFHPGANSSANTIPNSNPDRPSDYHHPFPSANSWVSGNSFASNAPLSALLPPSWPNHHTNNSVPSPPHNQHDYQRPGSMSATMARLELTLHHHIDSTARSMSNLITDKHDKIMDQTIRRLESLEETVSKGFRNLKADLKDIRKDIGGLKEESKDTMESSDKIQELFKGLDGKFEALEKGVTEHSCKCQHAIAERSRSEPENEPQEKVASHRRTESAHGALDQGEQRPQYRNGASRSTTSARQSGKSEKAHRSNTVNGQLSNRMSSDMNTRREYFTELGAARGPMPDLRDHPAYSGMPQGEGEIYGHEQDGILSILNGLPFKHPSLSDGGWYQQAYGRNGMEVEN